MISKFAAILALVAVALAADRPHDGYGKQQVVHAPVYGQAPHAGYGNHAPAYKPDDYSEPKPYEFAYNVKDDYNGEQHRQESGDGYGTVKGTYGYTDGYGIYRQVEYTADDYGYKASIKTNEPGTDNQNPADVSIYADPAPVKYEAAPKKGYGHQVAHKVVAHAPSYDAHKVVAHAPSYRAQSYSTPAYGHGLRNLHHGAAPAYGHGLRDLHHGAAQAYGHGLRDLHHGAAQAYGHGLRDLHHGAAPAYGHQSSYSGPVYGAAHPAVRHGSYASTHQRGYDAHKGGYGHATKVVSHGVQYADAGNDNQGYGGAVAHGPVTHGSYAATHQRGYDAHKGGYGHATKVVTHKVHH
ncbi:Uncharacterised protein g3202 [Pycnogonum litorale]